MIQPKDRVSELSKICSNKFAKRRRRYVEISSSFQRDNRELFENSYRPSASHPRDRQTRAEYSLRPPGEQDTGTRRIYRSSAKVDSNGISSRQSRSVVITVDKGERRMTNEPRSLASVSLLVYLYTGTRLPCFNSKPAYFTFIWPAPLPNQRTVDSSTVKYEFVFEDHQDFPFSALPLHLWLLLWDSPSSIETVSFNCHRFCSFASLEGSFMVWQSVAKFQERV